MKKSINAWAFPDEMSFEEVFATAKKYGFEAIELNVEEESAAASTASISTQQMLLLKR